MSNSKRIALRMSEDDLKIIDEIIENQKPYQEIVIHKHYGYTDAIRQALNLLYCTLVTHEYRLEPNTEEEKAILIEQDKEQHKKPALYQNRGNQKILIVDCHGNYTEKTL